MITKAKLDATTDAPGGWSTETLEGGGDSATLMGLRRLTSSSSRSSPAVPLLRHLAEVQSFAKQGRVANSTPWRDGGQRRPHSRSSPSTRLDTTGSIKS